MVRSKFRAATLWLFVASASAVVMSDSRLALASTAAHRTFLAVVFHDGMLVPVAVYGGKEWSSRWPWGESAMNGVATPTSLADIPKDWLLTDAPLPSQWVLQRQNGELVRIRAIEPVKSKDSPLISTIGIRTDYRVRKSDLGSDLEIGVAIAGEGTLGVFVAATPSESARLLTQLRPRLADLETAAMARWLNDRRDVPLDAPPFKLTPAPPHEPGSGEPIKLLKAVRKHNNATYYYADGEKLFFVGGTEPEGCKLNVSFDGVIAATARAQLILERLSSSGYAEYCGDRDSRMTPLATVEVGGHTFWILRDSLEDGFSYVLMNPVNGDSPTLNRQVPSSKARSVPSALPHRNPRKLRECRLYL